MSVQVEPHFFRENYALAEFADGGVLVDLGSGAYFHMNRSAVEVLRALQSASDRASAAELLRASLGLRAEEALAVINGFVSGLATPPPRQSPRERFTYAKGGNGYDVLFRDHPVLFIAADGSSVSVPSALDDDVPPLADRLKAATPKILFLQGVPLLHASACLSERGLIAFSGLSGAGKTTTGRAFAAGGRRLVSEDILVLTRSSPFEAFADGEAAAHAWAAELAEAITRDGAARADCGELAARVTRGPTLPVERILFLDRDRRAGDSIETRRLAPSEALLAIMTSNFLAAADRQAWRRYLAEWSGVASGVPVFEATVPPDLRRLSAAALDYRDSATS
jgi:hypothetical protein